MDQFALKEQWAANIIRKRVLSDMLPLIGRFNPVEHWRGSELIAKYDVLNDITNEGKNKIFNVMFNTDTQIANSSWYIGLISASGFSALAPTDTMASHAGWTELTNYTQANRPAWGSVTSTAQSVTNSTPAQFDLNATATAKGLFVVSNNTKGGTSGVLWTTAQFSSDIPVVNGDQLKTTYTVNA